MTVTRSARQRVKAAITREIIDVASRHLAEVGAASLSLRAVARELGMASSGVYRYFASRDELLTALIIDAYERIGDAAEEAAGTAATSDVARWVSVSMAIRAWAHEHPHEFGLLYGTPVPGYAAPPDTIAAASRTPMTLAGIVRDASTQGRLTVEDDPDASDGFVTPEVRDLFGEDVSATTAARLVMAWSSVLGHISAELGGHLHNVVADPDRFFVYAARRTAIGLGLDPGIG